VTAEIRGLVKDVVEVDEKFSGEDHAGKNEVQGCLAVM
jgi:hypothetical protein